MSPVDGSPLRGEREEGFAMIVAVTITMVAIMMVTVVLAMGLHLNSATVRERRWQLALEVAESGVEDSITKLRANLNYAGSGGAITAPGGQFETTVTGAGGTKVIESVGWVPSKTAPNRLARKLSVTMAPEPSFAYALFSSTSLFVNSGSGAITGDVFANESIQVDNTSEVKGDVVSATGTVDVQNAAKVSKNGAVGGNITSGGYHDTARWGVNLAANSVVAGDINIRVQQGDPSCVSTTPPPSPQQAYNLQVAATATVTGKVFMPAASTVSSATAVPASKRVNSCLSRDGRETLPPYTFDPNNYPGLTYMTASTFNSGGTLQGNIYVRDDGTGPIDFAKRQIVGPLALIVEPRIIHTNSGGLDLFKPTGLGGAVVQIISLNRSLDPFLPAIEVSNQFNVPAAPNTPAVLVYSPGYCTFKNSTVDNGAVYCSGMDIKNGLKITYDARVASLLGFGGAKLTKTKFVESPAPSVG